MNGWRTLRWRLCAAISLGVLGLACMSSSALAHEGEFAKFNYCPSTTPEVAQCLYSLTTGGEVVLGKKTVPITNDVTLQGGFSAANSEGVSRFFEATNHETLSKSPQNVPGGLLGIVPPENSPPLVKALSAFFFENQLTGLDATMELAEPASHIVLSRLALLFEEGVALELPVKLHLENPFLGNNCYIGSSSSPIVLELTTGETSPPSPNKPIHGAAGEVEFKEEGRILQLNGNELVNNSWSAPQATGCGGILAFLVDPIVDAEVGLPSAAGYNTAILKNTIDTASASAVNSH